MSDEPAPPRTARILDEYLVVAAQAGDHAAFGQLARRWHRKLVAHGWRLTGRRDLAEDVTQAAWVEIARGLRGLRDERAFPAWAYRIVTRQAAKRVGRIVADRALEQALGGEAGESAPAGPGQAVDGARLRAAIHQLPPAHRAAVALHYFDELSIAEIAVALDTPAGTIKTRLMHAREKLRAHFKGDDDA